MAPYEPNRDFHKLLGLDRNAAPSETIVRQAYLKSGMALSPLDS